MSFKLSKAALARLRQLQSDLATSSTKAKDVHMNSWGQCDLESSGGTKRVVPVKCNTSACMAGHLVLNEGAKFMLGTFDSDEVETVREDYDFDSCPEGVSICKTADGKYRYIGEYAAKLLGVKYNTNWYDNPNTPDAQLFDPDSALWSGKDKNSKYDAIRVIDEFIEMYS